MDVLQLLCKDSYITLPRSAVRILGVVKAAILMELMDHSDFSLTCFDKELTGHLYYNTNLVIEGLGLERDEFNKSIDEMNKHNMGLVDVRRIDGPCMSIDINYSAIEKYLDDDDKR